MTVRNVETSNHHTNRAIPKSQKSRITIYFSNMNNLRTNKIFAKTYPTIVLIVFAVSALFGFTAMKTNTHNQQQVQKTTFKNSNNTEIFAVVILYRPYNQLSRKYKVNTNINGSFEIGRKEIVKFDAQSNSFLISVDAIGHKKEAFTFNLSQNKTHYFRIQDRNNYSGFRPFLEVIEVTEDTFKRENFESKND